MDTTNVMFPTAGFTPQGARFASDGTVAVVDGRLHFHDVDAYVEFLIDVQSWTREDRAAWESESGFVSHVSYIDTLRTDPAARLSSSPVFIQDEIIGSMLSPDASIGIGDRVYKIGEGSVDASPTLR